MELASNFKALNNEANFGPPISDEVVGGTHIAVELVTKNGDTFYATEWPQGLPRHDGGKRTIRFPHGLMIFGETIQDCARRLVSEQLGMEVRSVKVNDTETYVDEANHWHIEPICVVEIDGTARPPQEASRVISFTLEDPPDLSFWDIDELAQMMNTSSVSS